MSSVAASLFEGNLSGRPDGVLSGRLSSVTALQPVRVSIMRSIYVPSSSSLMPTSFQNRRIVRSARAV